MELSPSGNRHHVASWRLRLQFETASRSGSPVFLKELVSILTRSVERQPRKANNENSNKRIVKLVLSFPRVRRTRLSQLGPIA
jgi:hypothetical protein